MPASKAQQKAVSKYMKANYDEIKIRIPKGEREKWKQYAADQGKSLNQMVMDLVNAAMEETELPAE